MEPLEARTHQILEHWEELRSSLGAQWETFSQEFLQATAKLNANSDKYELGDVLNKLSDLYRQYPAAHSLARLSNNNWQESGTRSPKDPEPADVPKLNLICNRILEKREQSQAEKAEQVVDNQPSNEQPAANHKIV